MALDGDLVRVAGAGHVYTAPYGTALPDDVGTALTADWVDLGYVTEDGVTFTLSRETEDVNAWQGDKIRILTLRDPVSLELALMQTSVDTWPVVFGGGTVEPHGTAPNEYVVTPPYQGENATRPLVVEFTDGDLNYRYVVAKVQIEGDVSYSLTRSGPVTYPITFGVLDNGDDPKYIIYTDDPAFAATGS